MAHCAIPTADSLPHLLEKLSVDHDLTDWRIMPEITVAENGEMVIAVIRNYGGLPICLGWVDRVFPDIEAIGEQLAGAREWRRSRTRH